MQKLNFPPFGGMSSDEGVGLLQTSSQARRPLAQPTEVQVHANSSSSAAATNASNASNASNALNALSKNSRDAVLAGEPLVQGHRLASLLALRAGLNHTSMNTTALDNEDGEILFYCMVLMGIFYLLAGVILRVSDDKPSVPAAENSLMGDARTRNMYQRPDTWARPQPQVVEEALPAISGFLLARSADMPLLIAIKDLEARKKNASSNFTGGASTLPDGVAWSIDINSSKGKKIMAVRQLRLQGGKLGEVEIVGRHGTSGTEKRLATINAELQLFSADRSEFGKLVLKKSGSFELKESATGRHRWLVNPDFNQPGKEFIAITWRPKRRLLANVSRNRRNNVDYMEVMNTKGVDAVLVTLCTVGLYVFRLDADPLSPKDYPEEDDDEEDLPRAAEGSAGSLLSGIRRK